MRTMTSLAPEFASEVFDESRGMEVWAKGRDSFYGRKRRIELDGPVTTALLRAFSAKLGMALYREHIGEPLPLGGQVFVQHYLNSGLQRQEAVATLRIMPSLGQLKQGKKNRVAISTINSTPMRGVSLGLSPHLTTIFSSECLQPVIFSLQPHWQAYTIRRLCI